MTKPFKANSFQDLEIRPLFSLYHDSHEIQRHLEKIKQILGNMLPCPLPFSNAKELKKWLQHVHPLMRWKLIELVPSILELSFFLKPMTHFLTETFIYEMIKRWLIPDEETPIISFDHMVIYFVHYLKQPFFVARAKVLVETSRQVDLIKKSLPFLKKEILKGIESTSCARSILETKTLSLDQKVFFIRDTLLRLIKRFPDDFDKKILQRFAFAQACLPQDFVQQRSSAHLTRVIVTLHLIRKRLEKDLRMFSEKRHMIVRVLHKELIFPFGRKPVLGLMIGFNLFHKFEFFEEKHILLSIQKFFPYMQIVSHSFYRFQPSQSPIVTSYIEVEKEDGSAFTLHEISVLRKNLGGDLKGCIEHLVPSLFVVRNEEEIMRNILILSEQIKAIQDLPQVMISFDQHSQDDLIFTIVLVRVKDKKALPIETMLKQADDKIQFIPDRIQNVKYLDQEHPVEANVFRIQILKLPIFLRMDFSVNLFLARQKVVSFLNLHLGEIRDYNGGMILKQQELLTQFKRLFCDLPQKSQDLLENFFYSLNPIEAQATISLSSLSFFFELFLSQLQEEFCIDKRGYDVELKEQERGIFAIIRSRDSSFKSHVEKRLKKKGMYGNALISSSLSFEGIHFLGYYFFVDKERLRNQFQKSLLSVVKDWEEKRKKPNILRIGTIFSICLDPRRGGGQETRSFVKMLFDGLMRIDFQGNLSFAIAESYTRSENRLRYTFKLRDTVWSNGSPLVAYDFEYAWKKILSPDFSTPFAFLFYPILNARKAKKGEVPLEKVGVKALDDKTLCVDLEYQAPYFLELTADALYSPVNHKIDQMHPNWSMQKDDRFIGNGPFRIRKNRPVYTYEMEKNPNYWNASQVYIDQILINKESTRTCFDMFNRNEIDYLGTPFHPFEGNYHEVNQKKVFTIPSKKIFWACINTKQFPFYNLNLRKALAFAVDRNEILSVNKLAQGPAFTILAKGVTQHCNSDCLIKEDKKKAKFFLKKALKELQINEEDIPTFRLNYSKKNPLRKKAAEAIALQWHKILGLRFEIVCYPWNDFFDRITEGHFQIAMFNWYSWINDPIYTLSAFKYSDEKINFSRWHNPQFKHLLDLSDRELDPVQRMRYLADAEEILIREVPVIPLCYDENAFIKNPRLTILSKSFAQNGNFDFSQTTFT